MVSNGVYCILGPHTFFPQASCLWKSRSPNIGSGKTSAGNNRLLSKAGRLSPFEPQGSQKGDQRIEVEVRPFPPLSSPKKIAAEE